MAEPVIRCILLDIEGTTCPVSFVASVLFPYARERLTRYLEANQGDPEVQALLAATQAAFAADSNPEVQALRQGAAIPGQPPAGQGQLQLGQTDSPLVAYLQWLIDHDIKFQPSKSCRGASGHRATQAAIWLPPSSTMWRQPCTTGTGTATGLRSIPPVP